MGEGPDSLVARIRAVAADVAVRARAAGRPADAVTIVAVTKTHPPEAIAAVRAGGLRDVGENYVQEARDKRAVATADVTWHLIGTLQRNKAALAARVVDRVHGLDDPGVAAALDRAAARHGRVLPVLLQIDVAEHPAGRGVPPAEALQAARQVAGLAHLALDGFMCVGPPAGETAAVRAAFARLRELRDRTAAALGLELPHLSMGMSDDYPIAIEEGATMLRLGRVLFGARGEAPWRAATT